MLDFTQTLKRKQTEREVEKVIQSDLLESADFAKQSQNSIFKSLQKVISSAYTRYELFLKLSTRLDKFFSINRASLAIYDTDTDIFKIENLKIGNEFRRGVRFNMVASETLMKQVLYSGEVYVDDFPTVSGGLELEKKLLIQDDSTSLVIIPLIWSDVKFGTFNLASSSNFAFSLFKSNLFNYLFEKTTERFIELPL